MIGIAERWCFVAVWSLMLPLVGYSFFVILTLGIAGFGLLAGVFNLAMMVYAVGFIPTLVTAITFEFALRQFNAAMAVVGVCVMGMTAAYLWWTVLAIDAFGWNYGSFALLAATAMAVSLMPFVARAWDERAAGRARVTIR
ncbi:MAG: hypothetical protein K2Y17_07045 [Qipengyuania sp.]|jgi:hypothetical protein|nr:hypothetical protein [Qipengyuania sp.]